jgi:hypothetical protein
LSVYLENPGEGAGLFFQSPPAWLGLAGFFFGGANYYVAAALAGAGHFSVAGFIASGLLHVAAGFFLSAWLNMILEVLGGGGRALDLFNLLGAADCVWALALPLSLCARLLWPLGSVEALVAIGAVWVTRFILQAKFVKEGYRVSWGKSLFALLSPVIILFLLLLIAVGALVGAAVIALTRHF